jgi:hypothetical protein
MVQHGVLQAARVMRSRKSEESFFPTGDLEPDFGVTFASSQVDGSAREECFHYA